MTIETDKLALAALERVDYFIDCEHPAMQGVKSAITALRQAISQPDCRGCLHARHGYTSEREFVIEDVPLCKDCTNGDKFQPMEPVRLYKVTAT
jgi:hypothetical protein